MIRVRLSPLALAAALILPAAVHAQGAPPPPPASAKAGAPIDLTGQWVALMTEDWRWRMMTPPRNDVASVPLNAAGKALADKWDLDADNAAGLQCKAYGVGGLIRQPTRLRISWADDSTLKLEFDAGTQTRLFHFISTAPSNILSALDDPSGEGAPSLQGYTKAQWYKQTQIRGLGYGPRQGTGGALRAVTHNVTAGYLRKNGVPYSDKAVVTEQYTLFKQEGGHDWLFVTTIVDDPAYLTMPFVTSTTFRREADATKWAPSPCRTDPPLEPAQPISKR